MPSRGGEVAEFSETSQRGCCLRYGASGRFAVAEADARNLARMKGPAKSVCSVSTVAGGQQAIFLITSQPPASTTVVSQ